VIGGRALGPGFGFCLGSVGIFASALLTGGFGPWVPFQMIGAAWVGMGAGMLPRRLSGGAEVVALAGYGAVASIAFGFLLNAWFWPFFTGSDTAFAFDPQAGPAQNLSSLVLFSLATSLGYDLPRAILTAMLTLAAGGPMLRALRRASRRANFSPAVQFQAVADSRPVLPVAPPLPAVEPSP
jgi:energy-coupling factor transport system substrate-specific component